MSKRLGVGTRLDRRMLQERLDFGAEYELSTMVRIVQRLDPQPIASQQ
jgi:hypothetical protein